MRTSARRFLEGLAGPLTFGRAVRVHREREGLTQPDLAERLGCSKQYIYAVETERRFVSVEAAAKFADALGLDREYMIDLSLRDAVARADVGVRLEGTSFSKVKRRKPKTAAKQVRKK